jgi:uncharacterized protein (TIGR03000 family)
MIGRMMILLAAIVALTAWLGVRPAEGKEWPGRYDQAARRYYDEEERDYRAMGYDTRTGSLTYPLLFSPHASPPNYRYYGVSAPPAPVRSNTARIRLIVPAEAQVWFDNHATTQAGPERRFESPALAPGRQYTYAVKAQWRDASGKEVTRTRQVDVGANSEVTVDLTR